MNLADGIRKRGFRAWHERELFLSFGWMILLLLCGVAALAALEILVNRRGWTDGALSVLVIMASGAIGIVALQRFLSGLVRAQTAAEQATCAQCHTFGRLLVVAEDPDEAWVCVRCRGCAHEWRIVSPRGDGAVQ